MVTQFGSGSLFGATLQSGVLVPRKFGIIQDLAIDVSAAGKELYGQYQWAVDVARGQIKVACKAKFANINAALYNDLFFGQSLVAGAKYFISQEAGVIPTTPFQITVAQSATWYEDFGVTYFLTGLPLTRVAAGPITGQYSVAAGVYTFAAADVALAVRIDYDYSPAATGFILTSTNPLVGTTPTFVASCPIIAPSGKQSFFRFNKCLATKLSFTTKIEDWLIPELDFIAVADVSNTPMSFSNTE